MAHLSQGSPDLALMLAWVSQLARVSVVLLALAVVVALRRLQAGRGLADTFRSAPQCFGLDLL
jgi:hypothetical protein